MGAGKKHHKSRGNRARNKGSSVPVLAGWLREMGIPHTVIASLPFSYEGKSRYAKAQKALDAMQESSVTVVSCEQLGKRSELILTNIFEPADKESGRHIQRILAEMGLAVIE